MPSGTKCSSGRKCSSSRGYSACTTATITKIDGSFDKIGSVKLNKEAQTLELSRFTLVDKLGTPPKFDKVSGKNY